MLRAATFVVLLSLSAGRALAQSPSPIPRVPAATGRPALTFTGQKFPPPGTQADQALLGEMLVAQGEMLNHRAWAITATQRLADGKFEERLAALQAGQPPERALTTSALRERLHDSWAAVTEIMTKQWLVDGRIGCRPQGIGLEVLMGPDGSQAREQRAAAREAARKCMERQALMVRPLEAANRKLDAAVREADAALATGQGEKATSPGGGK
jgi:hypothetical protein